MANATRSQSSIADLEKKFEDRHERISARLEQMSVSIAHLEQLNSSVDELWSLLWAQASAHLHDTTSSVSHVDHCIPHMDACGVVHNPDDHHRRDTHTPLNPYSTRISKVEFPRFDGSKVKEWLYKCDQFFSLDGTTLETKVWLASIHLDGIALQWHLNYMWTQFDVYPSWAQYVTDVVARFGEVDEDPLAALIQVKQTGKVQDYIDEFELASNSISDILP